MPETSKSEASEPMLHRAAAASKRMATRFATCGGGVGQIYDQNSKIFDGVIKEYLLAWTALLDEAESMAASIQTVEISPFRAERLG